MPARPGGTASGIVYVASPVLEAEKVPPIAPAATVSERGRSTGSSVAS
ncbi:hypothetical protein SCE1572_51530 [Sorangium cellulosum So0157-2]|uniref:Uncharacterized protein n=1 Tax=Sorangium cellulosum So0157-2 TaxID=1254432 RepID=S4YH51_SORCE|nr:hypothetical protein SCE1572_51530 [Sorangium cellulosum So0157-2]